MPIVTSDSPVVVIDSVHLSRCIDCFITIGAVRADKDKVEEALDTANINNYKLHMENNQLIGDNKELRQKLTTRPIIFGIVGTIIGYTLSLVK